MKKQPLKIGITGTGIAGLAAAARLAAKGHSVTCYEANSYYGGKLTAFETKGYRFDAGPSLFTLPGLVDDIFTAAGKNPRAYFNYQRKHIACRYFYNNGMQLTGYAQPQQLAAEMAQQLNVPAQTVEAYFKQAAHKYNRVGRIFMEDSLHRPATWFSGRVAKALLHLLSYNLFTTMDKVNRRRLKDPRLVQYFNRYATYNGSNPYAVPGLLTMIPHLEHETGTFIPVGGMHSIAESIYNLCLELGVVFVFNTPVDKIETTNGRATGLWAKGRLHAFDAVVCNMDIVHAYQKLLPQLPAPKKILEQERSSSALIFYWGIKKTFAQLDLHNVLFSGDYAAEFNHIFKLGTLYHDPTVYINISAKNIPGDAPAGCENWFVMINLPANKGYFTESVKQAARKHIIAKINRMLHTDIEPLVETEKVLDPIGIAQQTGSLHGSLYGTSSNSRMAAFNRHPNFSRQVQNLYFCGGSVHPGGGIPLCLNSAHIVSRLIDKTA